MQIHLHALVCVMVSFSFESLIDVESDSLGVDIEVYLGKKNMCTTYFRKS